MEITKSVKQLSGSLPFFVRAGSRHSRNGSRFLPGVGPGTGGRRILASFVGRVEAGGLPYTAKKRVPLNAMLYRSVLITLK